MIAGFTHWTIWTVIAHPLRVGNSVNGWGGILSCISEATLLGGIIGIWHHKNCHVRGCWRLGHIDPAVGNPACRRHHSLGHLHGTSQGAA